MTKEETQPRNPTVLQRVWKRINVQLSQKERLVFVKYLAVLLRAGLAIDHAISILHEQSKGSLKNILSSVKERLERGDTLAKGLADYPHVFGPVVINLVRAGEVSGTLQENLEHLVTQMEKEYDLRRKVRGAMVYPIIIILAAIGISIGIVMFILPNITGIFEALKVDIPLPTRILLWISDAISEHGIETLIGGILLFVMGMVLRSIKPLKPFFHKLLLLTPLIGHISKMVNLARFTRLTGTMVKSGMAIDEVLPITHSVLKNAQYQRLIVQLEEQVGQGESLTSVFEKFPLLVPPMAMRIIYVGEQSGSLEEMMLYIADFYEAEVDEVTHNLSVLIEPFLLMFIGIMVGGLVLSILMPIYQVIGSF